MTEHRDTTTEAGRQPEPFHPPKVTPFLFEGENLLRVFDREGAPWFVAVDVCRTLGIQQATRAVEPLDDDEKGVSSIHTPGGFQEVLVISEGGLYTLILRSRDATKPGTIAHRFRKWVTGEVLPSIRKTGSYEQPAPISPPVDLAFPNWPLDEMRTKKSVSDLYLKLYGVRSAQWITPQMGFPAPPRSLIDAGRQPPLIDEADVDREIMSFAVRMPVPRGGTNGGGSH